MLVIMKTPKKMIWMIKPTLITFPPFAAVLALTSIPAPVSLQYMVSQSNDAGYRGRVEGRVMGPDLLPEPKMMSRPQPQRFSSTTSVGLVISVLHQ